MVSGVLERPWGTCAQGTTVLNSHVGLRSRDRKRAEACAGAKRRRQSRVRRPRRLWACASRARPYRRPPKAMYDGAAVARRARVDIERCDPAVRLEEPARVRGPRASRTRHYNMFARGGSLNTLKRRSPILGLCPTDSSAQHAATCPTHCVDVTRALGLVRGRPGHACGRGAAMTVLWFAADRLNP